MIDNINLHCIFYFISFYFIFDTTMEKQKSKKSLRLFITLACLLLKLALLLKLRVSDV